MKKEPIRFDVAPQTYNLLLRLVSAGLWGETADEAALQCMYRGLQEACKGGLLKPVAATPRESATFVDDEQTFLWCEQCDRRVSAVQANHCASPFCKAKARAA